MQNKSFSTAERVSAPLDNITQAVPAANTPPPKPEKTEEKQTRTARTALRYTADIDRFEPRTKRFQALMKPSVYENIRRIAERKRQSINNYIESVLEAEIDRERAEYEQNREQKRAKGK